MHYTSIDQVSCAFNSDVDGSLPMRPAGNYRAYFLTGVFNFNRMTIQRSLWQGIIIYDKRRKDVHCTIHLPHRL